MAGSCPTLPNVVEVAGLRVTGPRSGDFTYSFLIVSAGLGTSGFSAISHIPDFCPAARSGRMLASRKNSAPLVRIRLRFRQTRHILQDKCRARAKTALTHN